MLSQFLLDQTRPIGLPDHVINPMQATVAQWSEEPRAPGWLNWIEDRLTTRGAWATVMRAKSTAAPKP